VLPLTQAIRLCKCINGLKKEDSDKFVHCVYQISAGLTQHRADAKQFTGFPQVVRIFQRSILEVLPQLKSVGKQHAITSLAW
jgi:hypothetical protein